MADPFNNNSGNAVGGFEFNRPTIISLLYLGSFITGVSGIVGIVLAYIWRNETPQPWEATHYTYAIRTFWIGLALSALGVLTFLIGIGVLIFFALPIWVIVRSVMSIVSAQKRAPMPNPQTLLI